MLIRFSQKQADKFATFGSTCMFHTTCFWKQDRNQTAMISFPLCYTSNRPHTWDACHAWHQLGHPELIFQRCVRSILVKLVGIANNQRSKTRRWDVRTEVNFIVWATFFNQSSSIQVAYRLMFTWRPVSNKWHKRWYLGRSLKMISFLSSASLASRRNVFKNIRPKIWNVRFSVSSKKNCLMSTAFS